MRRLIFYLVVATAIRTAHASDIEQKTSPNWPSTYSVNGAVNVANFPGIQPVSITNLPAVQAVQVLGGTVTVQNPAAASSTVTVSNFPSFPSVQNVGGTVAVSNFPASQPVTGTFFQGTQPVSGTFWQATQPVSGTVSVGNLPATQPVSGTFWQNTQPISGAVSVSNLPSSQAVTGTFWQATQPVSGAVSVSNLPATQPVSGSVSVSNLPATQAVSGTFWPATQPVSGTVAVSDLPGVSLGNATGKTNVLKTGTLITTAVTADQVVLTYTVTAGKTFYLQYLVIIGRPTTLSATASILGATSLETPAGTKGYTMTWTNPTISLMVPNTLSFGEPIPIAAGTVIRVVCTPAAVTSTTWIANFGGYEK